MPHNLNIVLVEPEIPMNTGTIGRLCLATGATLHLIEPLGFEINDAKLKRAGLDYWKFVNFKIYPNLNTFLQKIQPNTPKIFLSTKGQSEFFEHSFQENSYIFFGSETRGCRGAESFPCEHLCGVVFKYRTVPTTAFEIGRAFSYLQ